MQLSNNNYNSGTSYYRWNREKDVSACTGNGLKQGSTDFSKFQKLAENCRCQKSGTKQVPY
jgi:hypothetical protein